MLLNYVYFLETWITILMIFKHFLIRFISRVEEVLNDWKLINISSGKPLEKVRMFASQLFRGQCKHKKVRQSESTCEKISVALI